MWIGVFGLCLYNFGMIILFQMRFVCYIEKLTDYSKPLILGV
jgi:hypothetical protein